MFGGTDTFKDQWTLCLCIGSYKTQLWIARNDALAQHNVRTPAAVCKLTQRAEHVDDSAWVELDEWLSELWLLFKAHERRRQIIVLHNTETCPSFTRYVCRWLHVATASRVGSASRQERSSTWRIDAMLTSLFTQRIHGVSSECCVVIDVGHVATRITPILGGVPAFEVMGLCGPVCGIAAMCAALDRRIAFDEAHRTRITGNKTTNSDGGDAIRSNLCSSTCDACTRAMSRRAPSPVLLERAFHEYVTLCLDSTRDSQDRYTQLTSPWSTLLSPSAQGQDEHNAEALAVRESMAVDGVHIAGTIVADYLIAIREVVEMCVRQCSKRDMAIVWQYTVLCGGGVTYLPSLRHALALLLDELCPQTTLLWHDTHGDDFPEAGTADTKDE